jgi:tetratricopeptide (TPR) repeat protein
LEAVESFKKAAEMNPVFLPSYYNLGVIYWNLGDRLTAVGYFKKVLTENLILSKKQLIASKFVYNLILLDIPNPDLEVKERWQRMWQTSKTMVMAQKPLSEKLSLSLF